MTNKKRCATTLTTVGSFCLETVFLSKVDLTDCTIIVEVKYINLFTFPNLHRYASFTSAHGSIA